jgi:hypothetical protein
MAFGKGGKNKPKNKGLAKGDYKIDHKRKREADALAKIEALNALAKIDDDLLTSDTAGDFQKPPAKNLMVCAEVNVPSATSMVGSMAQA